MAKKSLPVVEIKLGDIVGGGQTIATMEDGRKLFVWGGLPGEKVRVQLTKKKSKLAEGLVIEVIEPSVDRVEPRDLESYLSTSPWQIMNFDTEQHYKSALVEEAFELHNIVLPTPIGMYSNKHDFEYRNKIEFSFWFEIETQSLSLAFFRRGSHGKISIDKTSLASPAITTVSQAILQILNQHKIIGRDLKTLLIRSSSDSTVSWQLYVKEKTPDWKSILDEIPTQFDDKSCSGEIIYSEPRSPASVITERLFSQGESILSDTILDVPFSYATEGFFQINLPVYEQALRDMKEWVISNKPVIDLYSGVGTIGLTIGGDNVTLVELNENAVKEMQRNIKALGRENEAHAVLAPSEKALEYITNDATIIVDPPRAGLHEDVVNKLLETAPERIIYLSCNPVTQARDVAKLAEKYGIRHHQGYNFFPRTPHIEHLVILDIKQP